MEDVYAAMALAIDRVEPGQQAKLLAKLALLLAHELGDEARTLQLIEQARADL
jgi:hypothetical protein